MMKKLNKYKIKLEEEKNILHKELESLGIETSHEREEWEATPVLEEVREPKADENELADHFEDFEERSAELVELKERLKDVNDALKKIEDEKYGICEVCGEEIEENRLGANPAARTCKKHMK